MARKIGTTTKPTLNEKKTRKGVHSKNKMSFNKKSKNYKKKYRGQGRP
jgi:hypothetical protein|tara:strand:+ start:3691 stop:3834 length:144 start_codon:yes stop_codon:yes gene_type:complete